MALNLPDNVLLMCLERREPENILTLYFTCYYYIKIGYVIIFVIYAKRN
jgi:hypothetical protein